MRPYNLVAAGLALTAALACGPRTEYAARRAPPRSTPALPDETRRLFCDPLYEEQDLLALIASVPYEPGTPVATPTPTVPPPVRSTPMEPQSPPCFAIHLYTPDGSDTYVPMIDIAACLSPDDAPPSRHKP